MMEFQSSQNDLKNNITFMQYFISDTIPLNDVSTDLLQFLIFWVERSNWVTILFYKKKNII